MSEPALELRGVTYSYPGAATPALDDVDLVIEPGELVTVAGPSASGKTTLLRAAAGLVPHFHGGDMGGTVRVHGNDTRDHGPAELARLVGLVAQDPETQAVSTTVEAEVELPLELRGQPAAARTEAMTEVVEAIGIGHLMGRAVRTLSGGELQRVALATALVTRPALVMLDEPVSQVDPAAADRLVSLLRRINRDWGTAVLVCEHRLERFLPLTDRVVALRSGSIAFDGGPKSFLATARPRDRVSPRPATGRPLRSTGGGGLALVAKGLGAELDAGSGPRAVLSDIDLEVGRGERLALIGANGAGKSTLLRCAAGLVEPSRGRIDAPRGCALLSQSPGDYLVRDSVGDELPGPAGRAALERMGLAGLVGADPADLSGGQRQRLALAIVMAGRGWLGEPAPADDDGPGLLCLDEPTRGMDSAKKHDLADLLAELAAGGLSTIVVTHDRRLAAEVADRIVLLDRGALIADGSPSEVLSGGVAA